MSAPHALTLLLTACVAFSTQAQTTNVRLDVWDGKGYQPCEPSIAMDPNNPDVVVAGSILDNVYRSEDGGQSWMKDKLTSPLGVFGDPCVVASPTGDFYFLHLSDPEGMGWQIGRAHVRTPVTRGSRMPSSA